MAGKGNAAVSSTVAGATRSAGHDPRPADVLDVAVVGGGGHVGLPLALMLADTGMRVGILDVNPSTLERIGQGEMPFMETGAAELLARTLANERVVLSADPSLVAHADQVIVVIGTPIDEFFNPVITLFDRTVEQLAPHVRDGQLVVLRSTVYPGSTEYVTQALRDRGLTLDVAFCPERIAEGHALEEIGGLPQIIGADDERAGDRAEALFRRLTPTTVRVSSREAEVAKLFTNVWRYVKFAVANQFFEIADSAGIDYTNVLRAIRQDYPRAADLPGPGFAAGPCLFKDTMQLSAFTFDHFPLGQAAMQVNEGLPAYLVGALRRRVGTLRGRTIGILGMAFKAESDDTRASLAFKLRKLLGWEGATVLCTDPYVRDPRIVPLERVMADAEILVVGAPHHVYRDLDPGDRHVVDVWNCLGRGIAV